MRHKCGMCGANSQDKPNATEHQKAVHGVLLTTQELADRWSMSPRTLENRRVDGTGPRYIKLHKGQGGAVRYRIADVIAFESKHIVEAAG